MSRLRVIAVLLGLMLLGVGELSLRFMLGPPPPAVRVFSALGQKHPQFLEEGPSGWVTTYQRVPTVLRSDTYAVVVGGSSVHRGGPGVVTDREFPAIAGRGLGRPVLNLGAPGLDSHDLLSLVEELIDLPVGSGRPEVIVGNTSRCSRNQVTCAVKTSRTASLFEGSFVLMTSPDSGAPTRRSDRK